MALWWPGVIHLVVAMLPQWEVGASHGSVMFNYCQMGIHNTFYDSICSRGSWLHNCAESGFLLVFFVGSEENQGVSAAWKWMVNMFSASPSSRAVSAALPWQDTKACFSDLQHIWCFCSDQSSHLEITASDFADIFVVMPVRSSFVSSFKLKCILWGRICCDMGGCRLGRGLFCSAKWALHGCICVWNFPGLPGTAQQWHFLSRWRRTLLATSEGWHVRTVVTWASALYLSFSM